jgi:hypothetical protein
VLIRLRLRLVDGRTVELAHEGDDSIVAADPAQALPLFETDGQIALSDNTSIALAEVASVDFAPEDASEGPGWGPDLQDEDVATATSESFPQTFPGEPGR